MKVKIIKEITEYSIGQIIDLKNDEAEILINSGNAARASWQEVARSALVMPKFLNKIVKK